MIKGDIFMEKYNTALLIIDMQRDFMPAYEGERLNAEGFGGLGIDGGERTIPPINRITREVGKYGIIIGTTQDWHPLNTAHFSEEPNFVNTWPVHCVGGTLGAELHPELIVAKTPDMATRFIKGDVACTSPEDDTSYTGALAYNPLTNVFLPDWLRQNNRTDVIVTGVALGDGDDNKLCVDSTAADLVAQGFNVSLVTDATEAVMPDNREKCFRNLAKAGVRLLTTEQVLLEMAA